MVLDLYFIRHLILAWGGGAFTALPDGAAVCVLALFWTVVAEEDATRGLVRLRENVRPAAAVCDCGIWRRWRSASGEGSSWVGEFVVGKTWR
eukprot:gene11215-biopygen8404